MHHTAKPSSMLGAMRLLAELLKQLSVDVPARVWFRFFLPLPVVERHQLEAWLFIAGFGNFKLRKVNVCQYRLSGRVGGASIRISFETEPTVGLLTMFHVSEHETFERIDEDTIVLSVEGPAKIVRDVLHRTWVTAEKVGRPWRSEYANRKRRREKAGLPRQAEVIPFRRSVSGDRAVEVGRAAA